MMALSRLSRGDTRYTLLHLIDLCKLATSFDLGPCLAIDLGMNGSFLFAFALASVCGAAVFFMLMFLRAFLRDARRPRIRATKIRFTETQPRISATPVSIEHNSRQMDRVA
jgi:hypothetical protein